MSTTQREKISEAGQKALDDLGSAAEVVKMIKTSHSHECHCGTQDGPHQTGEGSCVRFMTRAPAPMPDNRWLLDLEEVTDFTLRQQRGYHQHPCGCWSRWPGSANSIEA